MNIWTRKNHKVVETTKEDLISFLDSTVEIECDTETTGFDPHHNDILCVQFGNPNRQFLIEWNDIDINFYKKYLENPDKLFINNC